MTPHNEAAAIIAHYFRQLAEAAGRRWTEHNDHDMRRLAELLPDEDRETIAPFYQPAPEQAAELPSEQPRQIDTRVTAVLDRREPAAADDLDDPNYQRWRQRQREAEEARRLVRREVGR